MANNDVYPKGIWYEQNRSRWRVKLFCDGVLFHRSYHRSYSEALSAWQDAKKHMILPRVIIPVAESTPINRFLYQPLLGAGRGVTAS